MGDRVAVMRKGELQQVAPPQELYDRPVNLFVGGFIGSPSMNMLEATVARRNGSYVLALGGSQELDGRRRGRSPTPRRSQHYDGRPVILGIRPEAMEEASLAPDAPAETRLKGRVELREALGSELVVHFALPEGRLADTEETTELARESTRRGRDRDRGRAVVGRLGARAQVVGGRRGRGRGGHAALCTSSTRTQDLESTSRLTQKGATT